MSSAMTLDGDRRAGAVGAENDEAGFQSWLSGDMERSYMSLALLRFRYLRNHQRPQPMERNKAAMAARLRVSNCRGSRTSKLHPLTNGSERNGRRRPAYFRRPVVS